MTEIMSRHAAVSHREIINIEENLGINLTILLYKCRCSLSAIVDNDWRNYTGKKENEIYLIYRGIQMGSVAKFIYEEGLPIIWKMHKYLTIYEEAFGQI
jgi:hypothetical protein